MDKQQLLKIVIEEYKRKYPCSKTAYERASKRLPLGVSSSFRAYAPYPFFLKSAKGSRIRTVDDTELLDFSMSFGALMTGHAHPVVIDAVRRQLEKGTLYAIPHETTVLVADLLTERYGLPLWRFTNSGVESTFHALRVARGFTGKNKFIKVEGSYHGAVDQFLVSTKPPPDKAGDVSDPNSVPSSFGIPESAFQETLVATWNDLSSFRTKLERHRDDVAAIIVEPVQLNQGVIPPEEGFLEGLRDLADEFKTVLLFDEVKCGAKVAYGGAVERYGVLPDIVCLAKSIGGGFNVGAFGGKAEIMETISRPGFYHAGTYSANPVGMAAARATLQDVLTKDIYAGTAALCTKLSEAYRDIWATVDIPVQIAQVGSVGMIHFLDRPVRNYRDYVAMDKDIWRIYWFSMLLRGILPQPNGPEDQWTISVQHTEDDIDRHISVVKDVVNFLKENS